MISKIGLKIGSLLSVATIFLLTLASTPESISGATNDGSKAFYELAMRATHPFVVDKVKEHAYQEMYGTFLLPRIDHIHEAKRSFRFMEIGLGCSIPAKKKGIDVWNEIFHLDSNDSSDKVSTPTDVVWIAELKRKCVSKMVKAGNVPENLQNQFVYGDQSDVSTLQQWVNITGGSFDAIIDDGSHINDHIYTSLIFLWNHALAPGGMYFIEDLQVGRHRDFKLSRNGDDPLLMAEVIKDWIEQLIIPVQNDASIRWKYSLDLIPGIKSIYCQAEACVLFKCKENDVARCF